MVAFLKNPRFWLPVAVLLLIELVFRAGAWEPFARPTSYAGTSVATKNAVAAAGFDQVAGITLGDSRTVYGFDHGRLDQALGQPGERHVSLAMGGSHLAGLKSVADWSIERLPRLKRIIIGIAPGSMNRIGNGSYEIALVEPFRDAADYWQLVEHFPPRSGDLRSLGSVSALMTYREDLVDYLLAPRSRHKAIARTASADPAARLTFANQRNEQLCEYDLSTPAQCRAELQRLSSEGRAAEPAARTFSTYCQRPRAAALDHARLQALAHWTGWLDELADRAEVVLVLMPEHPLLRHRADTQAARTALAPLQETGRIQLVDLTELYPAPVCGWYSDLVHANRAGAQRATEALIEALAPVR